MQSGVKFSLGVNRKRGDKMDTTEETTEIAQLKERILAEEREDARLNILLRARNMGFIPKPQTVGYGFLGLRTKCMCPKCHKELSSQITRGRFTLYQHDCGYEYILSRGEWQL